MATIALAIVFVAFAIWFPASERKAVIEHETAIGQHLAGQLMTTRNHYIETVVRPLVLNHQIVPSSGSIVDPNRIPAPMLFAFETSDLRLEKTTRVKTLSPYPWPRQAGRQLEPFQQAAWDMLRRQPDRVLVDETTIDGRAALRVVVADRITSAACLACHNVDPASPKRDWAVGDLRAVMQVERVIDGPLAEMSLQANALVVMSGVATILASLGMLAIERAFWRRYELQAAAEAKVRYLAFHDPLTGLLNRARFNELAEEALNRARPGAGVALHLIDLDHFKAVNDRHGHAAGDEVICIAADRLRAAFGRNDLVARFGGDEFVVAQVNIAATEDAGRLAQEVVSRLAEPFIVGTERLHLSASVGVRTIDCRVADLTILLKEADKALYKAKEKGRDCFALYDADLDRSLIVRRRVEEHLRAMVDDPSLFSVFYQPLCDVKFGEVSGFEALMRTTTQDNFPMTADVFIPIAEDIGLIAPLGAHMLLRALEFARSLPDPLTIAVNISPRQFLVDDPASSIVEVTRRALAATGFPPHRLELEITEGLLLQSTDHVIEQINGLRALGVKLALDDFGVGYCNLSYLTHFPVDKLKIDKSFLSDALEQPVKVLPVLRSITALGRSLGLTIVAEGIETLEQAEIAEAIGCQQLQGYYFCRPIMETEVAAYILCNELGTRQLSAGSAVRTIPGAFWSHLAWIETSGRWSPVIAEAS